MNSREKGARGERELANYLKDRGFMARRGQQFSGANGDADVEGLDGIHIECKRVEKLNIDKAMEQSIRDAYAESIKRGKKTTPTVWHRANGRKWKVTMLAEDFLNLYRKAGSNGEE